MNPSRLPVEPEEFLVYYERIAAENPDPRWRRGAEMCRRWIKLKAENPSASEVRDFISDLQAENRVGSAWADMRVRLVRWARERGFDV